jgi:hypothetical protein
VRWAISRQTVRPPLGILKQEPYGGDMPALTTILTLTLLWTGTNQVRDRPSVAHDVPATVPAAAGV